LSLGGRFAVRLSLLATGRLGRMQEATRRLLGSINRQRHADAVRAKDHHLAFDRVDLHGL